MDYKRAQTHFIQQGLAYLCEPIQLASPKAQLTLSFPLDGSLDPLKVQPPESASLVLRFSAFKRQSIAFASVAATLPTDEPSSVRVVFHRNVARGLKKQPEHVGGSECTL